MPVVPHTPTPLVAPGTGSTRFTGTFEGLGNTISNLTIDASGNTGVDVGLFGTIGSGGVVRDLGLVGGAVTGGSLATAGGLAGSNYGTISNAYETGVVVVQGDGYVGGWSDPTTARSVTPMLPVR